MYGNVTYWDNRYARETYPFDWYQRYATLRPLIREHISRSHRVLVVGCGRSRLSEDLVEDGYGDVISVDFSSVCIAACRQQYGDKLRFEVADVADKATLMRGKIFASQSFDAILDKGCLDCLLCGGQSTERSLAALANISDLLKLDGGVYICVSYAAPTFRSPFLSRSEFNWDVTVKALPKPQTGALALAHGTSTGTIDGSSAASGAAAAAPEQVHYVYVCRKAAAPTVSPTESKNTSAAA